MEAKLCPNCGSNQINKFGLCLRCGEGGDDEDESGVITPALPAVKGKGKGKAYGAISWADYAYPTAPKLPDKELNLKQITKVQKALGLTVMYITDAETLRQGKHDAVMELTRQFIDSQKQTGKCAECGIPLPTPYNFIYCEDCLEK